MKKVSIIAVSVFVIATFAVFMNSCKGSRSSLLFLPGNAGVYVTDDKTSSAATGSNVVSDPVYSGVTLTIETIRLVNTATNAECDLLVQPMQISSLENLQFINFEECGAGPYNRIRVLLNKNTELTESGLTSACTFTSYTKHGSGNQPDRLFCHDNDDFCELNINGAVDVLTSETSKVALNIRLKDFIVTDFETPGKCTITMKVSPLNASQMKKLGYPEVISGIVSNVNTTNDTFDITRGSHTFSVLYSGITTTALEDLLSNSDGLRTKVTSSTGIDLANKSIVASDIK